MSRPQLIDNLLATLNNLRESGFTALPVCVPRPHQSFPETLSPFELPSVLVPPELDTVEDGVADTTERKGKRGEMPSIALRVFEDEVSHFVTVVHMCSTHSIG